jgi:hypothetical protein
MIEGMRRVSLVSVMAAAVVVGHLAYHLLPLARHPMRKTDAAAVALPPRPWATGAPSTATILQTARFATHTCRLQPPLTEADREFIERFQTCGVDVRELDDDVLVATAFGGTWTGARFRKTPHGWIALEPEAGRAGR